MSTITNLQANKRDSQSLVEGSSLSNTQPTTDSLRRKGGVDSGTRQIQPQNRTASQVQGRAPSIAEIDNF